MSAQQQGGFTPATSYGYQQVPQQGPQVIVDQHHHHHHGGMQQVPPPVHQVVVSVAACPACHTVGSLQDDFTCCGIALAIIFFPIGLICCFVMREKRCSVCGYTSG